MHFSASLAALSAAAILVQPISAAPTEEQGHGLSMRALGINCRGSPNCSSSWPMTPVLDLPLIFFLIVGNHLNFVAGAISKINMDKTYNNGDHIACLRYVEPPVSQPWHTLVLFPTFPVLPGPLPFFENLY